MRISGRVTDAMIRYYEGDGRRINHFLKVYGFAKAIAEMEGVPDDLQEIIEIAALTHDIGIKISEEKYSSASGYYQQIEGPPAAKKMLEELLVSDDIITRVCWLIAHHHTYDSIDEIDYQILVEADFLVNLFEDNAGQSAVDHVKYKIFKTRTGLCFLEKLYPDRH